MDRRTDRLLTERLTLVPLSPDDAVAMVEVLGDERLYAYIGGRPPTLDELRARYGRLAVGRSADGTETWHNWIVRRRKDDRAIGTVQATVRAAPARADVAWIVGRRWQGRGYATEAARALVGWLSTRGVDVITAHVHPDHVASALVAARAGLAATDEMEDGERVWRWVRP